MMFLNVRKQSIIRKITKKLLGYSSSIQSDESQVQRHTSVMNWNILRGK
ncbi:hypothetical protein APHNP_1751 [Anaplasma phagocytophilum str. ApNP]|uniref:Uncharacterized protein n=1 Tax=Anaplasma phagocytophilum str. ApNP TaxID=1359153 RepID=A0A0F3NHM1_ANAPH|nr:hypothetical protein APHNP_1751 [Anaplasma phagocytophilum str. ApNP]